MDNDPKHRGEVVTECLEDNKVNVLAQPLQTPDLSREKAYVNETAPPKKQTQFHQFCQEK